MLHHVAKKGSVAMLKLFLEAIPTPDLRRLLSQKDVSSKDTLLLYVCRGCGFAAILEVLHVSEKGQLAARNHRWDTCLHLIALNRKLTLVPPLGMITPR